jgi:hypothetical protein
MCEEFAASPARTRFLALQLPLRGLLFLSVDQVLDKFRHILTYFKYFAFLGILYKLRQEFSIQEKTLLTIRIAPTITSLTPT